MKKRDSNYELMRIISMFLIVLFHTIHHSEAIGRAQIHSVSLILELIEMFTIVHVNSFVLVTGYFNINSKFRVMKAIELLLLSFFYLATLIFGLNYIGETNFPKNDIIALLNPLTGCSYWFVRCYILMYLFSPFLNKLLKSLSKSNYKKLLILMVLFFGLFPSITSGASFESSGFTFVHFCMMYCIGAYLRLYPLKWDKKRIVNQRINLILMFVLLILLNFFVYKLGSRFTGKSIVYDMLYSSISLYRLAYNNVLVMMASIIYFLFFGTLHFQSRIVNIISASTFGVYLIHDNDVLRSRIYRWAGVYSRGYYTYKYIIVVLLAALAIFTICLLIESIRRFLTSFIKKTDLYKDISEKINYKFQIYV